MSCMAALATLSEVERLQLNQNAHLVGSYLRQQLEQLQETLKPLAATKMVQGCIGQIRGRGFFQGIELVKDVNTRVPATNLASAVVVRLLKKHRILSSLDGRHDNVLVFKPPMCFSRDNVDSFVHALEDVIKDITEVDLNASTYTPT